VLVLTRKRSQSVMIGDDIEVSVLGVVGEKVRLGITAPRSVPVYRTEVYVQMHGGSSGEVEVDRDEVDRALQDLGSEGPASPRE
jgi:carbon storage regulator